jgi:hypothetical protein
MVRLQMVSPSMVWLWNGLTHRGWSGCGMVSLTVHGLPANGLHVHRLAMHSLTTDGPTTDALAVDGFSV